MQTHRLLTIIKASKPCYIGQYWLETQVSLQEAWNNCPDIDWMFWALHKCGLSDIRLNRIFISLIIRETPIQDGRMVWDLLQDERSRSAVETIERWIVSEATQEEAEISWTKANAAYRDAWIFYWTPVSSSSNHKLAWAYASELAFTLTNARDANSACHASFKCDRAVVAFRGNYIGTSCRATEKLHCDILREIYADIIVKALVE